MCVLANRSAVREALTRGVPFHQSLGCRNRALEGKKGSCRLAFIRISVVGVDHRCRVLPNVAETRKRLIDVKPGAGVRVEDCGPVLVIVDPCRAAEMPEVLGAPLALGREDREWLTHSLSSWQPPASPLLRERLGRSGRDERDESVAGDAAALHVEGQVQEVVRALRWPNVD